MQGNSLLENSPNSFVELMTESKRAILLQKCENYFLMDKITENVGKIVGVRCQILQEMEPHGVVIAQKF